MDDETDKLMELLRPIDWRLGQALRLCQGLESSLVFLHELIDDDEKLEVKQNVSSIDSNYSEKTLGQLVNLLKKRIEVRKDSREFLFSGIQLRNEIVHGYFTRMETYKVLNSAEGREELCLDLDRRMREIRARDLYVCELIDRYLAKYGTSTDEAKEQATVVFPIFREIRGIEDSDA